MAAASKSMDQLFEKIRHLPTERIAEVEDFVDFLHERTRPRATGAGGESFEFPVISAGEWPRGLNLWREDIYGDDGR